MEKKYQDLLKEIRLLNEKYHSSIEGRKEIIHEIREKSNELRKMTSMCNAELDELKRYFDYRDYYINDYKMVMALLLRLANSEEELYSMKEITTTGFYNTNDKEVNKLYGKVLFIGEKSFIDQLSDHLYYYDEFKQMATNAINDGHSMILITSNLFEPNVKPRKKEVKCDCIYDIRNGGILGDITCFINDEELKKNIDKYMAYVDKNGPDFSNIDEDVLFDLISSMKKSQKTLSK